MRVVLILLIGYLVLFVSAAAAAEEQSIDVQNRAEAAFVNGKDLFHKKKYKEAAEAFRKAYSLRKSWRLFFNIGQSETAAKRYGLALEAFERYVSEGGDDVPESRQDYLIKEMMLLRNKVGFVKVEGQRDDIVIINEVARTTLPHTGKLRVAMGKADIRVIRKGATVLYHKVDILGGEIVTVKARPAGAMPDSRQVVADQVESDQPDRERARSTNPDSEAGTVTAEDEPDRKRLWTWVALGFGGAAGVAGGIIGGVSLSKKEDFMSECGDNSCLPDKKSDKEKIQNLALTADILYVVSGIGIAAGIALFFVEPRLGKEKKQIALVPTASQNSMGIEIMGTF